MVVKIFLLEQHILLITLADGELRVYNQSPFKCLVINVSENEALTLEHSEQSRKCLLTYMIATL